MIRKVNIVALSLALLILSLGASELRAQAKVGTASAPFLGIAIGPRAAAMGGAFAALGNDVTALYWNPGGIAMLEKSQLLVSHTQWLVNTDFNWAGFVLQVGEGNALGLSVTLLDYGEEEVVDEYNQTGTGARWSANDLAVAASYARRFTDRFAIGGNAKYIQQKIWNETASSFAFDVGLLFITQFNDMRLGMSISNFGADMKFGGKDLLQRIDIDPDNSGNNETLVSELRTERWPLPLFFRVGLAYDLLRAQNTRVTLAADALRPSDNTGVLNLGTEVELYNTLFLRGGYKSLFREDSEEGLTLGAGVKYNMGAAGMLNFDFAYADYGLLDNVKMFSLGLAF
ncbi:MAG: hypothetical protein DKINENOH_00640 [bacterium]|nr:hypothetical protein [bacterium]